MINYKQVQARVISWLVLFLLINSPLQAQYEKMLVSFPEDNVSAIAETYDNALLLLVDNSTERYLHPSYVIKFSPEGKEIWRKGIDHILSIEDVIATKDSGFAIGAIVNLYPGISLEDTSGYIALLKFNKCAELQWARYVPVGGSVVNNVIEGSNGELFVCAAGINGFDDYWRKPVSVLKFDKNGNLALYKSYEGIYLSRLYNGYHENEMYLNQNVYVFMNGDTNTVYAFSGITKVDNGLNTLAKTIVGYKEKQKNGTGPLVIRKNDVISILTAFSNENKPDCIMFSAMDRSLKAKQNLIYDAPGYNIGPAYAAKYNDSIITSGAAYNRTLDSFHTSLRIYNNNFELLKEVKINKNWTQIPNRIVQLRSGNIIQSIANFSRSTGIGGPFVCEMYMYDQNLNPVAWPTVAPVKGYDWGCNSTIPADETIYVDSVVTPVYVEIDTTKPDWSWLYALSTREPKRESIGKKSGNWLVYPQPLQNGDILYLQSLQMFSANLQNLKVLVYDIQGKLVQSTNAYLQDNIWVINNLQLNTSSLYLATLVNPQTGEIIGKIKITKQ